MEQQIRTHRVGSLTAGVAMILYGILFLLHLCANLVSYETIFRLWPVILISMGLELLLSNLISRKFFYDKGAVALLLLMTIFACGMAGIDMFYEFMRLRYAV